MTTPLGTQDWARNRLLAGLPEHEVRALSESARSRALAPGDRLYGDDGGVQELTFPFDGGVSLILVGPTAATIEVMAVGAEGAIGLEAYHGDGSSPWEAIVQTANEAAGLPFTWLRANGDRASVFARRLERYGAALIHIAAQGAFCAQHHADAARAAKWLLAMQAPAATHGFPPTVDMVALMLGFEIDRTVAAIAALRASVAPPDDQGQLVVRDLRLLAVASCACPRDKRDVLTRLFGPGD